MMKLFINEKINIVVQINGKKEVLLRRRNISEKEVLEKIMLDQKKNI